MLRLRLHSQKFLRFHNRRKYHHCVKRLLRDASFIQRERHPHISPYLPSSPLVSPHTPPSSRTSWQVPRILTPLIAAVRGLDSMDATPGLSDYVHARFGSVEECRKLMLADFFRHAFDGSGADNFFDAGSCIDGRLTSAWNWCSTLPEKPFYMAFKLAGFTTFDGNFQA